jgi:hypothetical protein
MKLESMLAGGPVRAAPDTEVRPFVPAFKADPRKSYTLLDISMTEAVLFALALYLVYISIHFYGYLLFHTLAELFAVIIAITISIITINCFSYIDNPYLKLVGISSFFVAHIRSRAYHFLQRNTDF